jgi:hypothetical protein
MSIEESWLKNFKHQEFIKKNDITNINIFYLYVNKDNCLEYVKEGSTYILQSNVFDKTELINIIKKNTFIHKRKYKLLSILKYNVDIDIDNLEEFLDTDDYTKYISTFNNLDDIEFNQTIKIFEDLNSIFIIFHENVLPSLTKKIRIKKRSNKKTKHKRFKE